MDAFVNEKLILLKGGEVFDIKKNKREPLDVVIKNGKIDKLGQVDGHSFAGKTFDIKGHLIVPGLIDMHVHLREPGREDEETVESGSASAMAGGITGICAMPNTDPPCDKQEVVRYLIKRSEQQIVDVYPIAAITKKRLGKEITEMAELIRAGAVAFSDDGSPVKNSAVMRRALEYSSMYGIPIIDHCEDPDLSRAGDINEGRMSTRLGLPGIPDISEDIMIARDLTLAEYAGGHMHIAHISTRKGVMLVRRAKDQGIRVTCEVTPHHLCLSEETLSEYDTNLKMNPPLRTQQDIEALIDGLKDGTIDAIASDHAPHSIEEKDVEFSAAPFGILGLQTMLGIILTKIVSMGYISLGDALHKMVVAPREILNLPVPAVKRGEKANLSIFSSDKSWTVKVENLKSLSRNMPYTGWKLNGVVYGVFNKGVLWKS